MNDHLSDRPPLDGPCSIDLSFKHDSRIIPVIVKSIADGHCLTHSICMAMWQIYQDADNKHKHQIARDFRQEIANKLLEVDPYSTNEDIYYNTVCNGSLPSFAKNDPYFSLQSIIKRLNSSEYLGEDVISIMEDILNIQIYIIDVHTMDIYQRGGIPKERNAVVLLYHYTMHKNEDGVLYVSGQHYDTIGILTPSNMSNIPNMYYTPNHPFIKSIMERICDVKK